MAKPEFDVVGLGVNTCDLTAFIHGYPQPDTKQAMQDFTVQGGGMTATAMVACARLGLKTRYIGKTGSDFWSRLSIRSLAKEGIDTKAVIRHPTSPGQISVVLADQLTGQRTLFTRRPVDFGIKSHELNKEHLLAGRLLHLDGIDVPASLQAVQWAREAGMIITMDGERLVPGIEDVVPYLDQLIANPVFLTNFTHCQSRHEALQSLSALGVKRVAVSLAEKGVLGYENETFFEVPGFQIEAVDTNGAGDVLHGACAFGELRHWPFAWTLTFACAVAAMKCRALGGRQAIPTLAETKQFLTQHGHHEIVEVIDREDASKPSTS